MPGDDLVPNPTIALTRAVTIEAQPAQVWPWLVQMGYRRAGWYSNDFFYNNGVHVKQIIVRSAQPSRVGLTRWQCRPCPSAAFAGRLTAGLQYTHSVGSGRSAIASRLSSGNGVVDAVAMASSLQHRALYARGRESC